MEGVKLRLHLGTGTGGGGGEPTAEQRTGAGGEPALGWVVAGPPGAPIHPHGMHATAHECMRPAAAGEPMHMAKVRAGPRLDAYASAQGQCLAAVRGPLAPPD